MPGLVLQAATTFAGDVIQREPGHGGMAVVYLAEDPRHRRLDPHGEAVLPLGCRGGSPARSDRVAVSRRPDGCSDRYSGGRKMGFGTIVVILGFLASTAAAQRDVRDWDAERKRMVERQLKARDIIDGRVLDAMRNVPRHLFVPEPWRAESYADYPLPIGYEQTISQPYIVAFMTQSLMLQRGDRVLEIGTGSGYQAAVLSVLVKEVYTIEIVAPLAARARETLKTHGYRNVEVRTGNGYLGWPEHAPYDRIMVTAAPDEVPPALVEQLKVGGVMAIPVGRMFQELRILRRTATGIETLATLPVRFVPMVGKPRVP